MNLDELNKISEELGKQGHKLVYDVVEESKYRLPGSEGERKGQDFLKKKMEEFGAEEIEENNFYCRPKFFKYWPKLTLFIALISFIVYFFSPLLTIILVLFALINVGLKLLSYTFLDVFFKKQPSSNVIGKLRCKNNSDKPKRIMIYGGHTDSTYEFPLGRKYQMGMVKFYIIAGGITGIWILTNIIKLIFDLINGVGLIYFMGFDFTWYYMLNLFLFTIAGVILWNIVSSRPVPGANDNLSGVSVAMIILKYFAENPDKRPDNVEYWAVCFGAEEGGMAGSKFLSKKLKQEMDFGVFPAESLWVVNFDSVGADGSLEIASKEPMYRATHNPEVVEKFAKAAEKVKIKHIVKSLAAGTDSAPFSRLGIPAVGVVAIADGGTPAYWHAREDTPENCNVNGIISSIKLGLQFIQDVDNELSSN